MKLRDRINAFATVVGNLQPILAQVPTFIEQAAMSAGPQEEDVLMSEFDQKGDILRFSGKKQNSRICKVVSS